MADFDVEEYNCCYFLCGPGVRFRGARFAAVYPNRWVVVVVLSLGEERKLNKRFAGYVKPGLPSFAVPPFSTQVGNNTYNFIEMASTLGTAIFVVPLFGILENIALAKAFCKYSMFFKFLNTLQ